MVVAPLGDQVEVAFEDAAHGAIAAIAGVEGALTRLVETGAIVALGEAHDGLGFAQIVEGVDFQPFAHEAIDGRPHRGGAFHADLGREAQKGLGRLRVVVEARRASPFAADMAGNELRAIVDGDHGLAETDIETFADEAMRDGVARTAHLEMAVRVHFRRRPRRRLPRPLRQGEQRRLLPLQECLQRALAGRAMDAPPGDVEAPGLCCLPHLLQAGEAAAAEEARPCIVDVSFDFRFVGRTPHA